MPLPSASEAPLVFFMQQEICGGLETGCRFQLKQNKKGLIQKNEENKKLHQHLERGESYLCHQRLSAPVPRDL